MQSILIADIIARAENMSKKPSLTAGVPYTFYPVNNTGRNIQSSFGSAGMIRGFQHATASNLPVATVLPSSTQIVFYDPTSKMVKQYNTSTKTITNIGAPYSATTNVYYGMVPIQPAAGFEGGRRRRKTRRSGRRKPLYTRVRKVKPLFR
jgi:hypothetical protein